MRMYDLIEKKKQGRSLTEQELDWMIAGFTEGAIPDYQMAAFLMAVCFQGMSEQETTAMPMPDASMVKILLIFSPANRRRNSFPISSSRRMSIWWFKKLSTFSTLPSFTFP